MGLDIYAGPVCRYVAGDWMTVVQQFGIETGTPVQVLRTHQPEETETDYDVIEPAVRAWQEALVAQLGPAETWNDDPKLPYTTDKPDWDGYGAVVLLAAYDERPGLVPGSSTGLLRRPVREVLPREFAEAPAFKAANAQPVRYPVLLSGAEWCLPVDVGPAVFRASAPNGSELTMGRLDLLVDELGRLNSRTLDLDSAAMDDARRQGPPQRDAPFVAVAPFGLAVLYGLAQYAIAHSVPWIMDY